MKKSVFMLIMSLAVGMAHASQFNATIEQADCQLVAKNGSVAGAIVGGGLGAGVGAALGGALFGKTGRALGGLAGGAGGAIAGENIGGSKTYSCVLKVRSPENEILYGRTMSATNYSVGQTVKVTKTQNEIIIQ